MSLKFLCAGCSQEEREQAESDVRRALGSRADGAAWTVSLVKVAGRWSVTLAHPPAATITCVAPEGRLAEAIGELLGGGGPPVAPAAGRPSAAPAASRPPAPAPRGAAPARGGAKAVHHECESCREPFVVRFESGPDESEETVPVACPHCWHRNYVLVAESAAESREYTAEKI